MGLGEPQAQRLGAARNGAGHGHKAVVMGLPIDEGTNDLAWDAVAFKPKASTVMRQWIAAYMIFSCVASVAEYSTTTLPCLATKMRSDSDITSGR